MDETILDETIMDETEFKTTFLVVVQYFSTKVATSESPPTL